MLHAVHVGKFLLAAAAGLEGAQQRFALGGLLGEFGQGFVDHGVVVLVARAHQHRIGFAVQARGLDGLGDARDQLRAQVFAVVALRAAAVQLQDGVVHMLGRDRVERVAVEVVARQAGGHALQVAGGARVLAHGDLQVFGLEVFGVARKQLFVHAELQRHEARAEELRVQLEQPFQRRADLARRALGLALALSLRCLVAGLLLLALRALAAAALVVLPGWAGLAAFTGFAGLAGCTWFARLRGRFRAGAGVCGGARVRVGTGLQLLQLIGHVQLLAPGRARVRLRGGGGSVGHAGGAARGAVE